MELRTQGGRLITSQYKTFAGILNNYNVLESDTIIDVLGGKTWTSIRISLRNSLCTTNNKVISYAYIFTDNKNNKKIVGYSYHDMKYVNVPIQDAVRNDQLKKYL